MNIIIRISDVLLQKYGFYVPLTEIGYESLQFYKEEIDEELVPAAILEPLDDPIHTESASYTDAEGNYYLVLQIDIGEEAPYEVWLVNDEVQHNFVGNGA